MGIFYKTTNNQVAANLQNETPLFKTDNGFNIFERDNESLIWTSNTLLYKKGKKEFDFDLADAPIIEYSNERGLLGDREISIWCRRTDKLAQKYTPANWAICNSLYKKKVYIMFSKKEADSFLDLFNEITSCLGKNIAAFSCTKEVKPLKIDEQHALIKDDLNRFMRFSDIIDCEIIEDGETIVGGNVGKALIGGAILGPIGAVAGAAAKKKITSSISNVSFKIYLSDINKSSRIYSLLDKSCKKSDSDYKVAIGLANQLYSTISAIIHSISKDKDQTSQVNTYEQSCSAADEIRKYKSLLDDGIITQEEFEAKKKQLLNL